MKITDDLFNEIQTLNLKELYACYEHSENAQDFFDYVYPQLQFKEALQNHPKINQITYDEYISGNYRDDLNDDQADELADELEDDIENTEILQVKKFPYNSLLMNALIMYFGSTEEALKHIRSAVRYNNNIYYVTGIGYDTISADLLDAPADGKESEKFLNFINHHNL